MLRATSATEDGYLTPACLRPLFCGVTGTFFMAGMAGVIAVAAWEFDGQDIQHGMIVNTPCQSVNGPAVHQYSSNGDETLFGQ